MKGIGSMSLFRASTSRCLVLTVAWTICRAQSLFSAEPAALECRSRWHAVLEGDFTEVSVVAKRPLPAEAKLRWSFTIGSQTLVSGHVPFSQRAGQPCGAVVTLQMPDLKREGTKSGLLKASLVDTRGEVDAAVLEKQLWIFPRSPFEGKLEWLESLELSLFDPLETTGCELDALGVPYEPLVELGELTDEAASQGILIIGEGVSFSDHPGLAEALVMVASQGRPVLVLAPTSGSLPLPGIGAAHEPEPRHVAFRKSDAIRSFDVRLDAEEWPGPNGMVASGFKLEATHEALLAEFGQPAKRWPWLDIEYPTARGRLIVCGFGIIRSWDDGATPRHLFAQILHALAGE